MIIPYFLTVPANTATDWVTPAGALGTTYTGTGVSLSVKARSEDGKPVTYQVVSGTLPPGLTLNSKTGSISGIITDNAVTADTVYIFTISAIG